jgi:hypothetical protein
MISADTSDGNAWPPGRDPSRSQRPKAVDPAAGPKAPAGDASPGWGFAGPRPERIKDAGPIAAEAYAAYVEAAQGPRTPSRDGYRPGEKRKPPARHARRGLMAREGGPYTFETRVAWRPFGPCVTSNSTF